MIAQELPVAWLIVGFLLLVLFVALICVLIYLRVGARFWATWFRPKEGGTLLIVAFGTFGVREALRMVTTFGAARAANEVSAVILADFHQEVFGYARTIKKIMGRDRVITPTTMPPGAGQGFMHKLEHDWRTQDIWTRELERMVRQARRLNARNGSTITTIYYILPAWSGHLPLAPKLTDLLRKEFRKPIIHIGHLNRPSVFEAELRRNMLAKPGYPMDLGLDGVLVSDEQKDPYRERHDWTIAAGVAGLFAANRVDPGQQHGANPVHSLVEFAKGSRGLIGLGVGQSIAALIPKFTGLRRDIAEQDLSRDTAEAIDQALTKKAWDAPNPPDDIPQFVSVVVPLDLAHPQWRPGQLRAEAIKDLREAQVTDAVTMIWTSAAVQNGPKDSAPIFALWLYPITDDSVSVVSPIGGNDDRIREVVVA